MAQEIIVELYSSLENVNEINNFQGWVWSIARYTFYHWLDKRSGSTSLEIIGPLEYEENIEKKVIGTVELNCLRREISFLSERYRRIVILFYFENKTCEEIAEILNLSVGTIKWYLYDARKKLKWGMDRVRNIGESSYRPGNLNLGLHGSTGKDNMPFSITYRKIPQNILLKSYKAPQSIEQLSEELGVARPYMEEEVKLLIDGDLLKKMGKNKVQTNFIIADIDKLISTAEILLNNYKVFSEKIINYINGQKKEILDIDFYKEGLSWERLLWVLIPICIRKTLNKFKSEEMNAIPFDKLPKRKNGGRWVGIGTEKPVDKDQFKMKLINKFGERNAQKVDKRGYNGPVFDSEKTWGKWWLGTFWSGYNNNDYYKSIKQEDIELFKLIAEDKLNLDKLNQEQKELLSHGIKEEYLIKTDNALKLNFPFFFKRQLESVGNILIKIYPDLKEKYTQVYKELVSEFKKDIPDHLENEIDNYISVFLYELIILVFDYGLDKQLISEPLEKSSFLSFYIWYKE